MSKTGYISALASAACLAACSYNDGTKPTVYSPQIPKTITPSTLSAIEVPAPDALIPYGESPQQVGEWRIPEGKGPFPAVLMIHGGCWRDGFGTRATLAPMAEVLAGHGIASYNIDYRELGVEGAGWPGTFQDWARAASMFDELASQYPIDRDRLTVLGHSAGTTASVWLSKRPSLPPNSPLRGSNPTVFASAVHVDGPMDMATAIGADAQICRQPTIVPFMGGTPEQVPENYRITSALGSGAGEVRQMLVVGPLLSNFGADRIEAAMRAAGNDVTSIVAGNDHLGMLIPGTMEYAQYSDAMIALIKGEKGE